MLGESAGAGGKKGGQSLKRCAIYCRVSTDEQATPGHVSLESQQAECRRYVVERGGRVVLELQDIQSGLDPTRVGYQRVLEAARLKEIDAAVVWRFDRWGRDAGEALTSFSNLQRLGVAVESVMEPTSDPFLQGLFALLGYRESQAISQRTAAGLRTRAARGEWSGPPPLGYQLRREAGQTFLSPDLEIAPLVRELFEEAASGRYSLAELTSRITARGLRSRKDYQLSRQTVGRMLRNRAYVGTVVFGKTSSSRFGPIGRKPKSEWVVKEEAHPAIVDSATFEVVQGWLTRHQRKQGTVRHSRFLLTSLVFCARCSGVPGPDGKPKVWRAYGHGTKGAVYQCSRSSMYGACELPTISAPGLEVAIRDEVARTFAISEEVRKQAARFIVVEAEGTATAVENQRASLERAIGRHQRERTTLARRLLSELIPPDVYRQLESDEARAIEQLQSELTSLPEAGPTPDVTPVLEAVANLDWNDMSWEGWRQALTLLVDRILLSSRTEFHIEWQPAADILRRAVDRVSLTGSRRLG